MSEEEPIEKLNKLIERCNECKFATCENCEINWTEVQAIQGLLDLYNKEKEKNNTLENLLQGNLYEMYKYYKELANSYQANSISKDKIKEEIKKLEEMKDSIEDIDVSRVKYAQLILKDLLDN